MSKLGSPATLLYQIVIPHSWRNTPVGRALGGLMGILVGVQLGCAASDSAAGDFALRGNCEALENPEMHLGRGADGDYAMVSDGDDMAFRATVEAGSDLELSMTLWGVASQILAVEVAVTDDDIILAEKTYPELEPLCVDDGSLLLPSLLLSFGSLGLIDLEDRRVQVAALVQGTNLTENLDTQIQVRLIANDEEHP